MTLVRCPKWLGSHCKTFQKTGPSASSSTCRMSQQASASPPRFSLEALQGKLAGEGAWLEIDEVVFY